MMKHIILTGANGFVGRYVLKRLYDEGYSIMTITRQSFCCEVENIRHIYVDLFQDESVNDCLPLINQADVLVHLAADTCVPGDGNTIGNNIKIMQSVLEIAMAAKVKQFIYLSSIPVIGNIKYLPIDENHPVCPKTSYHWSKFLCEKMLEQYKEKFQSTTVIRIPSPIGVGMKRNVFLSVLVDRFKNNEDVEIYGKGARVQNYIDVRDISGAILKAIESEPNGVFLVGGERAISNLELARLIKRISGSASKIHTGIYEDSEESDKWIISCDKANRIFGYTATYHIEDTINWIIGENDENCSFF